MKKALEKEISLEFREEWTKTINRLIRIPGKWSWVMKYYDPEKNYTPQALQRLLDLFKKELNAK